MDRNSKLMYQGSAKVVALRKESVDRNIEYIHNAEEFRKSLSARRAWIEMSPPGLNVRPKVSLSARRAWIEITPPRV